MTRLVPAFACAVILACLPAFADVREGNGEIGFGFGITEFDSSSSSDSGVCGSIRGGYHFTNLFELEGQVLNTTSTDFTWVGLGGQDLTMTAVLVNAVFNFHPKKETVVPYVLAGVGRVAADVDLNLGFGATYDDNASAYQAATGVRFFFGKNKRAAFRIEASWLNEDSFDESSTHTSFAGGFTWRIGSAG